MEKEFYSNGKLLLSGEYGILDGACGLAIPTTYGQSLKVTSTNTGFLDWKSYDADQQLWLEVRFSLSSLEVVSSSEKSISNSLLDIFNAIRAVNAKFLQGTSGLNVETHLTFPRNWGLGTSSTLINNMANWAQVDAHKLLQDTFGGSGYDISCAQYNQPILYQLKNNIPNTVPVNFDPLFKDSIFFIYLNEKKNSREAISNYRSLPLNKSSLVAKLSEITQEMVQSTSLGLFKSLMVQHEQVLSKVLGIPPIKSKLFSDYPGAIKSLGAWGGDFIMATGGDQAPHYFKSKGFETVLKYSEMAL